MPPKPHLELCEDIFPQIWTVRPTIVPFQGPLYDVSVYPTSTFAERDGGSR